VAGIVGSGIMAERLSSANQGLALLENALATAGVLFVVIAVFGPISGGQFNPVVTLADAWFGGMPWRDVPGYVAAQTSGACAGSIIANLMFGLGPVNFSAHERGGSALLFSEVIATFGLLLTVFGLTRGGRSPWIPAAVAAYIAGAYWFTSSTSFANPAVTIGRSLSNTFAGIAPSSVPGFVLAQATGGVAAVAVAVALWPRPSVVAAANIEVLDEVH
jgi:arsenate reductase